MTERGTTSQFLAVEPHSRSLLIALGLLLAGCGAVDASNAAADLAVDLEPARWQPSCNNLLCDAMQTCTSTCGGAQGCLCLLDGGSCLPSCYVLHRVARRSEQDSLTFTGLLPNAPFKVTIGGDTQVGEGTTDCGGGATLAFTVPSAIMPAWHLIAVDIVDTGYEAVCVMSVID